MLAFICRIKTRICKLSSRTVKAATVLDSEKSLKIGNLKQLRQVRTARRRFSIQTGVDRTFHKYLRLPFTVSSWKALSAKNTYGKYHHNAKYTFANAILQAFKSFFCQKTCHELCSKPHGWGKRRCSNVRRFPFKAASLYPRNTLLFARSGSRTDCSTVCFKAFCCSRGGVSSIPK